MQLHSETNEIIETDQTEQNSVIVVSKPKVKTIKKKIIKKKLKIIKKDVNEQNDNIDSTSTEREKGDGINQRKKIYSQEELIELYISSMDDKLKIAFEIAKNHLESSFDIEKSIGFKEFTKKFN
jgi:hypothetical protein